MNDEQRESAAIAGIGLAACAVCCAGPIVAAVGVGALGPIGIGAAAVVGVVAVVRHRRGDGAGEDSSERNSGGSVDELHDDTQTSTPT